MNIDAIRFVAKALLENNTALPNGDYLKFNMKNWCGTACCIAGWTNILIGDNGNSPKDVHELFSAERKLGLSRDQALALFSPALNIPYSKVTPQQAAEVLVRLADTGKVDWGKLKKPPLTAWVPEKKD
jgi:hypothetical protein